MLTGIWTKITVGVVGVLCAIIVFNSFKYKNLLADYEEQKVIIAAQDVRDQEQIKTIEKLQDNLKTTTDSLLFQTKRNNEIEIEMNRYLDIFSRHNLSKLAAAKPGLIEPLFNKGTEDVFKSIEEDSVIINGLND